MFSIVVAGSSDGLLQVSEFNILSIRLCDRSVIFYISVCI